MPTPNWLSGWVKINSKHGTHIDSPEKSADAMNASFRASIAPASDDSPVASRRSMGSAKRGRNRGLLRTFSASDLIREAATSSVFHNAPLQIQGTGGSDNGFTPLKHQATGATPDHDSDTQSTAKSTVIPLHSVDGSQFLDEISFVEQLGQTERHSASPNRNVVTLLPLPQIPASQQGTPKTGLAGLLPHNFFASQTCQECSSLKTKLELLQEDLEYMRKVALQRELGDEPVEATQKLHPLYHEQQTMPTFASKQLTDLVARQRTQVEQLMKERSRWRHDMHFKLTKFANLCRDLNEEAALRNSEAISLRKELQSVKGERDAMAEELVLLRAQMEIYQKDQVKWEQTSQLLADYESRQVSEGSQAIHSRDATIADLTRKLDRALTELEATRLHATQRRIIFPETKR